MAWHCSSSDIMSRTNKAREAFNMLKTVWNPRSISPETKVRSFNSNVKTVLLSGAETWRGTKYALDKIQTFTNQRLRRILSIRWQDEVRNEDMWKRANQGPMEMQLKRRRWMWVGHTLRRSSSSILRQCLQWNIQRKRPRGRARVLAKNSRAGDEGSRL